jgi:hypothetical protein
VRPKATTLRFSDGEIRQLDRLATQLGFSRADTIRYAVVTKRQRDLEAQRSATRPQGGGVNWPPSTQGGTEDYPQ